MVVDNELKTVDYWPMGKKWFLPHYQGEGRVSQNGYGGISFDGQWRDLTDRRWQARTVYWFYRVFYVSGYLRVRWWILERLGKV